jgi:hypothetical protein
MDIIWKDLLSQRFPRGTVSISECYINGVCVRRTSTSRDELRSRTTIRYSCNGNVPYALLREFRSLDELLGAMNSQHAQRA